MSKQTDHGWTCDAQRYPNNPLSNPAVRDATLFSLADSDSESTFVTSLSERDPDSFRKGAN